MITISPDNVDACLTYDGLVETLREAFRQGAIQPVRHHHTVERAEGAASTLLLMPAWTDFQNDGQGDDGKTGDGHIGVKIATVSPDNNAIGKPAVMGVYLLLDGKTGEPQALIDGQRLTLWRTACASALAASYLARKDARKLLVVGAGALSPHLVRAHSAVRPIDEVAIWNRNPEKAAAVAKELSGNGVNASAVENLDDAVAAADIISCATLSTVPLVRGDILRPGTHVDLVGAFSPSMRESDDEAIRRARVFVDTRAGTGKEAGDIVQALESGALSESDIIADLHELARDRNPGRQGDDEITLFKSVGAALEDFAAGIAVYEAYGAKNSQ